MITEFAEAFRTAFYQYFSSIYFYPFTAVACMMLTLRTGSGLQKRVLVYIPVCIFVITLCNPVYWKLAGVTADYTYSRSYWLIPIFPVIACALASYISRFNIRKVAALLVIFTVVCVVWGGNIRSLCTNKNAHTSENIYKLPQDVVDIADAVIANSDGNIRMLAPNEINMYIRQYDARIGLVYHAWNEEITFEEKSFVLNGESRLITFKSLTEEMNRDWADIYYLIAAQPYTDWNYLVLKNSQYATEEITDSGLKIIYKNGNYTVFVMSNSILESGL